MSMDRSAKKEPFVFPVAMRRLRAAVKNYPKAAMFELADEGFTSMCLQLGVAKQKSSARSARNKVEAHT